MRHFQLVTFLFLCVISTIAAAKTIPNGYLSIAQKHQVPAKLFYAMMVQESVVSTTRGIKPWPWTLNLKGQSYRYASRKEAFQALKQMIEQGETLVDVGLGQVNWYWHQHKFNSLWEALDPYKNLNVAAKILREQYLVNRDWWDAVGRYRSPGKKRHQIKMANEHRVLVKKRLLNLDTYL